MSLFEEVCIRWDGSEYKVAPDRVMGLIEVVEDCVTIEDLSGSGLKRGAISKAYASALRYAGCKGVTQQDVFAVFFDPEKAIEIPTLVNALLIMMIPPKHLRGPDPEQGKEKDSPAKKPKRGRKGKGS